MTDCLKARMRGGSVIIGCWINLFDTLAAEIVGRAGYDCVMIDLEHGPGDVMDAISVMQVLQADCRPLVRVPANEAPWIKRVLDAGAEGVMIPAVNSRDEARAAAAACHYAPRGSRGMAAVIVRAADFGASWQDYVRRIEEEILVICQVESGDAVANIAEIVEVEDVDLLFIGPFDLSASMGYLGEPDHPDVRAAIARVETATKRAGKFLGGIATPERPADELVAAGYDLILQDSDLALLRDSARANVARLRETVRNSRGAG
ncbi:MAG: hypothetical protein JSU82_09605 [Rhodospirillales bacterium]|nr:MAG: hypothetical protein JSU82_09605 [Rhodospirillales bacterium]